MEPELQEKKPKILYLITKSSWGGAGRYVHDLATSLPDAETVVAAGGAGTLFEKLSRASIRTIALPGAERDVSILKDYNLLKHLITFLKEEQPDILHVNSSKLAGLGALAGRIVGTKNIVFTAHGWPFNETHRSFLWRFVVYLLSWLTSILAHQTITITKLDHKQGRTMWFVKNKMHYIPLSAGTFDYYTKEEARFLLGSFVPLEPEHTPLIGSIGELHNNKDYVTALSAFATFSSTQPNARYIIISSGEEETSLKALTQELGLTDKVFFAGFVPDARQYLKAFDLFLLTSRKEGLPYVLLEAGETSTPVLATNVGGVPDILGDGAGTIVPKESPEELSEALGRLLVSPSLLAEQANNLHERVQTVFPFDQMIQKTKAVYFESR